MPRSSVFGHATVGSPKVDIMSARDLYWAAGEKLLLRLILTG